MNKYAILAAAVAASTLIAGSAGAAELHGYSPTAKVVHIALAGKSAAQIDGEIKTAAYAVCGADSLCERGAIEDADTQLNAIAHKSGSAKVEVARQDPSIVRVSLAGKSPARIEADIQAAADTVCKATNDDRTGYAACVGVAVSDAKAQLKSYARSEQRQQLARN